MLSEQDKQLIKDLIDRDEPLPARYRASLFEDPPSAELIWPGKTSAVETAVLPFQSIEHVDEPRQEVGKLDLFSLDSTSGRQASGWTNKLIWGDNRLVLSSLANGPMREHIDRAGGLKLVYIDPPFDVGADFSVEIEVGDGEKVTKQPSVVEEVAYRDTWGQGRDSYAAMLYERLTLIRDLLSENGSIYVHTDWRVNSLVRFLLDEIFGPNNFRNEIAWCYTSPGRSPSRFKPCHDTIFYYAKGDTPIWNNPQQPLAEATLNITSLKFKGQNKEWKRTRDTKDMVDWWEIIFHTGSHERLGYPTQKPEDLIERIVEASSRPGDLVADFFCGSGTTMAVAEQKGRKWIGADLSRFAVHTSRKRLIDLQRELKASGEPYRAFEVLNLGKYERQYFVGVDMSLPEEERRAQSEDREEAYLQLILQAYNSERATSSPPFHGVKGTAAVLVGPLDAPVTESLVREAVDSAVAADIGRVDVLSFEFEMGLKPLLQDEARERGVNLAMRYIPSDVFDKRATEKGDVVFHDVAYVELSTEVRGQSVTVSLEDFGVFYRQEDADAAAAALRKRSSRVVVDGGQVVKISKDKDGSIEKNVLTADWSDWIDYWAIDFDYESQPEVIRVLENGEEKQFRTGRFIFENRWQSYRTRQDRKLELTSALYEYDEPGEYKVAVKVIDIFGNDTTKVAPVTVEAS